MTHLSFQSCFLKQSEFVLYLKTFASMILLFLIYYCEAALK